MIINTLALSGLWYTGTVVPLPAWAEKKINQIIFDFLWSGKNEQIKCEVCYQPYELGGLKVVNVALKCRALLAKSAVFITDSTKQSGSTWPGILSVVTWEDFITCGVCLRVTQSHMPGQLPLTI